MFAEVARALLDVVMGVWESGAGVTLAR